MVYTRSKQQQRGKRISFFLLFKQENAIYKGGIYLVYETHNKMEQINNKLEKQKLPTNQGDGEQ